MTFKAKNNEPEEIMLMPEPPKPNKKHEKKTEEHASGDKLYELHDFDIDLDVQMPMPIAVTPALPKPVEKTQDAAPKIRRSLNLEDYKKKRGLI
jgi:RNA polymerase-associated protein RTF1